MLKFFWKRCWKMTFSHYFYHNFWFTKIFWVRFALLEIRHPGLKFEHKFCMIWIYIEWVMAVWSWASCAVKFRVFVKHAYTWVKHAYACLEPAYTSLFSAAQKFSFGPPRPQSLMGDGPQTLRNVQNPLNDSENPSLRI